LDKYISCDNHKLAPNFSEAQTQHHKKIQKKKNYTICQFNFCMASYGIFFETFRMKILTFSKKVCLSEINSFFNELNKIDLQTTSMSFSTLLKFLFMNKETCINAL